MQETLVLEEEVTRTLVALTSFVYVLSALILTRKFKCKNEEFNKILDKQNNDPFNIALVDTVIEYARRLRSLAIIQLAHGMLSPMILLSVLLADLGIITEALNVIVLPLIAVTETWDSIDAIGFTHKIEALMELKKEALKAYMKNTRK